MGLFDFWKKRRRYNSWEDEESDDIELEVVDFGSLSANDRNTYIEEQCEIIVQCNNNVENAKRDIVVTVQTNGKNVVILLQVTGYIVPQGFDMLCIILVLNRIFDRIM